MGIAVAQWEATDAEESVAPWAAHVVASVAHRAVRGVATMDQESEKVQEQVREQVLELAAVEVQEACQSLYVGL